MTMPSSEIIGLVSWSESESESASALTAGCRNWATLAAKESGTEIACLDEIQITTELKEAALHNNVNWQVSKFLSSQSKVLCESHTFSRAYRGLQMFALNFNWFGIW